MDTIRIENGKIVTPNSLISGNLEIEGHLITYIGPGSSLKRPGKIIDAQGKFILPGFIDIHTNGIAGFDLTNGVYDLTSGKFNSDETIYLNSLDRALYNYVKTGATGVLLTSLAAPLDQLKKVFQLIKKYKGSEKEQPWRFVLKGLFIEGTFMKLADFRGAHNPEYFNEPNIGLFDDLQKASGGNIKIVNVVPEWGSAGINLIRYLTARNIICAAGHTGATGRQYGKAIESGLKLAVHFLNGPTGSSSKSFDGGGAVETVLRSDKMSVEIIVDGYHVDKAYVRDTIRRKGFDRVAAITDSMFAAQMPGLTDFEVAGIKGKVGDNGEYLQVAGRENALFGSKLTMDKAFTNLLNWLTEPVRGIWYAEHEKLPFEEALLKTAMMCSSNPARILGFDNNHNETTGSLETGKTADVVIADIVRQRSRYHLTVDTVITRGIPVI